jgi:hypothetical protein
VQGVVRVSFALDMVSLYKVNIISITLLFMDVNSCHPTHCSKKDPLFLTICNHDDHKLLN